MSEGVETAVGARDVRPTPLADPAAKGAAGAKAHVFISYSRKDAEAAARLGEELRRAGFEPFIDKTDIAPGEPWRDRLSALIATADSVVFLVSPDSAGSPICQWEIAESERLGKRIFPLVCRAVDPNLAPASLSRLNWIFADEPSRFPDAVETLSQALRTDLPWVREHTRLGELARAWEESKRARSRTLRGGDLEGAEKWLASRPAASAEPTALQQAFIRASRQAATARQRNWVVASVAAAVFSLGLAGWAEYNRRDAVEQRNQAETARKEAVTQRDAAEAARKEADAQRDRATRTLDAATTTARELAVDLAHRFYDVQGVRAEVVSAVLGKAKDLLDQLQALNPPTLAIAIIRVDVLSQIAMSLGVHGAELGQRYIEEAYKLAKSLRDAHPDNPEAQEALGHAAGDRATILYFANNAPEALKYAREASVALGECARLQPTNLQCLFDDFNQEGWVGNVLVNGKMFDAAIVQFQKALAIGDKIVAQAPDQKPSVDKLAAGMHMGMGNAYQGEGNLDAALEQYRIAEVVMEARARDDDALASDIRALANLDNSMANVLFQQVRTKPDRKKIGQLLLLIAKARDLIDGLAKTDPNNSSLAAQHALLAKNLENACLSFGFPADPAACLRLATSAASGPG